MLNIRCAKYQDVIVLVILSKKYFISVCPNINDLISINIAMTDNFTMDIFYYIVQSKIV